MKYHARIFAILLCNGLFLLFLQQLNHWLTPWSVYLHLDGLLLLFGAFYLRTGHAVTIACISGLLLDAHRPVVWGTHAAALMLTTLGICWWRIRLRRENRAHYLGAGFLANLILYAWMALRFSPYDGWHSVYVSRLLVDGTLSSAVFFLIAGLYAEGQYAVLHLLGEDLTSDSLEGT